MALSGGVRRSLGGVVQLLARGRRTGTPGCRRAALPSGRCAPPATGWPPGTLRSCRRGPGPVVRRRGGSALRSPHGPARTADQQPATACGPVGRVPHVAGHCALVPVIEELGRRPQHGIRVVPAHPLRIRQRRRAADVGQFGHQPGEGRCLALAAPIAPARQRTRLPGRRPPAPSPRRPARRPTAVRTARRAARPPSGPRTGPAASPADQPTAWWVLRPGTGLLHRPGAWL